MTFAVHLPSAAASAKESNCKLAIVVFSRDTISNIVVPVTSIHSAKWAHNIEQIIIWYA